MFRGLVVAAKRVTHWLTLRHPTLGLRLAGAFGKASALRANSWHAPSAEKLTAVLGPLEPAHTRRIRRAIGALQSRNEALVELLRHRGLDPIRPLITTVHAEPLLRLRRAGVPIVVVSLHQGPMRALSLALRTIGVPALVALNEVLREPDVEGDAVRYAGLQHEANDGRFLKRAHRVLAEGSVVFLQLDCATAGETVPFLGRQVVLGRGAASLARLTGARLVPATRRFRDAGWRMEVTFHEPIDDADLDRESGAAFERALLARTAQRLEVEIRRDPGSMRPSRVDWLLSAPREVGGADTAPAPSATWRRRRRRARNRQQWERNWASVEFDPPWVGRGISPEIQDAVASGWFAPGSPALDAGCGEGDVAAWLAERGHPSVGVDIAESAVARARRTYGERPGLLRFERADLCEGAPPGGPFQVVVDRGCFLQLADEERRAYAALLATACADDARLLVFGRAFRDGIAFGDEGEIDRRRAEVLLAFGPYFEIERVAPTYLDRHHGERPDQRLPGIVFWLRRLP